MLILVCNVLLSDFVKKSGFECFLWSGECIERHARAFDKANTWVFSPLNVQWWSFIDDVVYCYILRSITPLHKSGNIESICNYRPISCLSSLSLVFERLLFNKLYDFFSPQLSGSQFGFMRRKSTVLQLIIYLQTIYNNVDTNTDCYALYLDFSKAFDSVSHATLLAKLRLFGIGGSLLSLLSSYLANRAQCVN